MFWLERKGNSGLKIHGGIVRITEFQYLYDKKVLKDNLLSQEPLTNKKP